MIFGFGMAYGQCDRKESTNWTAIHDAFLFQEKKKIAYWEVNPIMQLASCCYYKNLLILFVEFWFIFFVWGLQII